MRKTACTDNRIHRMLHPNPWSGQIAAAITADARAFLPVTARGSRSFPFLFSSFGETVRMLLRISSRNVGRTMVEPRRFVFAYCDEDVVLRERSARLSPKPV